MNAMRCWAVQSVLRSYPAESLARSEQDAIAKHLAQCPACAQSQEESQHIRQLLVSIGPVPVPDARSRNAIEQAVMNTIRSKYPPALSAHPMNLLFEIYEDFLQEPLMTSAILLFGILVGAFQLASYFH